MCARSQRNRSYRHAFSDSHNHIIAIERIQTALYSFYFYINHYTHGACYNAAHAYKRDKFRGRGLATCVRTKTHGSARACTYGIRINVSDYAGARAEETTGCIYTTYRASELNPCTWPLLYDSYMVFCDPSRVCGKSIITAALRNMRGY